MRTVATMVDGSNFWWIGASAYYYGVYWTPARAAGTDDDPAPTLAAELQHVRRSLGLHLRVRQPADCHTGTSTQHPGFQQFIPAPLGYHSVYYPAGTYATSAVQPQPYALS